MKPDPATAPRPFLPTWFRWHDWLTATGYWLNSSRWETGYVVLLLGFVLVYQLASPIVLGDTDMWYHLNGGRYFWEHGEVPISPFFSFNDPERVWINYFWGFQALVYQVHELAGYQGLIVLRAVLVFACMVMIWRVIAGFRQPQTTGLALLVLLALYVVLIDGRAFQLRPHLFSYFFIALFLYVLEHRPRLAFVLPPITVLWVNFHGIEYVVAALIGGAYLLEFVVDWRRGRPQRARRDWRYAAAILVCAPALLVNPHAWTIFAAPFVTPRDLMQYVAEMRPLSWESLSTFVTTSGQIGAQSAFALLFVFAVYSAAAAMLGRRARLAHLLLLAGGTVLLSRGNRFIWEWALLALPLLATQAASYRPTIPKGHAVSPGRVVGLAMLLAPVVTLGARLDPSKPYPFDPAGLPVGTTAFLRNSGAAGNLLMNPSYAGYTQWELHPRIRVFADMELPPFNDWDMYRIFSAHRSGDGFKRLLTEHPIDFILVELHNSAMPAFIRDSGSFAPIFFDDSAALYANRERQAALVAKHELTTLNPMNLMDARNVAAEKRPLDERLLELEIAWELNPSSTRALHALTYLLVDAKRFNEAERWADAFVENQPRDPNSHYLKGVILENTDRCPEATKHFERAFPLSTRDFHAELHKHLGACGYLTKDFSDAYENFQRGVNIYLRDEPNETLYQYAFSAFVVGDAPRARILLQALLYKTPDKEEHLIGRARGLLAAISSDAPLDGQVQRNVSPQSAHERPQ